MLVLLVIIAIGAGIGIAVNNAQEKISSFEIVSSSHEITDGTIKVAANGIVNLELKITSSKKVDKSKISWSAGGTGSLLTTSQTAFDKSKVQAMIAVGNTSCVVKVEYIKDGKVLKSATITLVQI